MIKIFIESDLEMHVKFGIGTKHVVNGFGIVPFWMESTGKLRVEDVLWMQKLKRSVISVSMIEKKRFDIAFHNGKVLIIPRESSSYKAIVFGVRERNLYRLKGQPMREIANNIVIENRE